MTCARRWRMRWPRRNQRDRPRRAVGRRGGAAGRARVFAPARACALVLVFVLGAGCAGTFDARPGPGPSGAPPRDAATDAAASGGERPTAILIQPGDTLFALTERYHVALRAVIEANDLPPPFTLRAGDTLVLPPPNIHRVARGETLYALSRRYRVHAPSLALMNGLEAPYTLEVGQPIRLPALARDWMAGATPLEAAAAPRPPARAAASGPETLRARPAPVAAAAFDWPLRGRILAPFGPIDAWRRLDGVKIAATEGAPVRAARDGEVVYAGDALRGYGGLILVRHDQDWITAYAHSARLLVAEGERVSRGQVIAEAGATGGVGRPQLHFEMRKGGRPVDPLALLPRRDT